MNDENVKVEDAREAVPEVPMKERKDPGYGPGHVNMAIPDRGHMPSCLAMEWDDANAFNAWAATNQGKLIGYLGARGDKLFGLVQTLKSDATIEEIQMAARYTEEKMAEFKAAKKEQEEKEEKARKEKEEADDECRRIGRLCIEKHGAFVKDLPGLSKIKVTRKSIADDIVKEIELWGQLGPDHLRDEFWLKLQKILAKYVKEGA